MIFLKYIQFVIQPIQVHRFFVMAHISSTQPRACSRGDPLGPLIFCLTLHPILLRLSSSFRLVFLDDVSFGGRIDEANH